MLSPDEESDRFLATKDLKLVGYRRGIFVFCYVAVLLRRKLGAREDWLSILCFRKQ